MEFLIYLIGIFSIAVFSTNASSCPTRSNVITFDDIKHSARASREVYKDDKAVIGATIRKTPYKIVRVFEEELFEKGEGIRVAIADHGNTRMIIFRGTDGLTQLLREGASVLKGQHEINYGQNRVQVLKFFWSAFELVYRYTLPYIQDPKRKYIITGHSLGGALASMMAIKGAVYHKSLLANPQSSLITFGQPRVGDAAYAKLHDQMVPTYRKIRVVFMSDPVTKLPPYVAGYRHHSRAVYLGRGLFSFWGKKRSLVEQEIQDEIADPDFEDNVDSADNGYIEPRSKRFFFPKNYYMQVCEKGEAKSCVVHLNSIAPNLLHHAMLFYSNALESSSLKFWTIKSERKSSWEDAFIASCHGE
uniref:Fungal lipase-type domain-containing protein n=2 Tax=Clytia hemisphaerica TaxID=252671 RepID=A0A7M5WY52_9CNID